MQIDTTPIQTVLIIGATGSVGQLAAAEAVARGFTVRAVVRDERKGRAMLPADTQFVVADVTVPETLRAAAEGIDAVIFTHGSHGQNKSDAENVDYGAVRNALDAIGSRRVRIALMTSIGVTVHDSPHNLSTGGHDWKRRSERLVRRSGHPYTIVRPSWFDYNAPEQRHMVFLQGDLRRAGSPADGVIARDQIARVLVDALTSEAATGKTLELVAEVGEEQRDLEPLFAQLGADPAGSADGVRDPDTLPLDSEPADVLAELDAITQNGDSTQ